MKGESHGIYIYIIITIIIIITKTTLPPSACLAMAGVQERVARGGATMDGGQLRLCLLHLQQQGQAAVLQVTGGRLYVRLTRPGHLACSVTQADIGEMRSHG